MVEPQVADVAKLASLQKMRKLVVAAAVGLLILSFFKPNGLMTIVRSLLWVAAGVLWGLEGKQMTKLGLNGRSAFVNAAIYLGFGGLVFLLGR